MAELVLFHHALGLTPWLRNFADELRAAGHTVHTPDAFDGRTFDTIEAGMAHAEELGFPMEMVTKAREAVADLPTDVVYVGLSMGVLAAQSLAQTRPGARGAVLCYAALPLGQWGDNWPAEWPDGVRLQLHILEGDEDVEYAQSLADAVPGAELFIYPGSEHYFAEHDDAAAALMKQRVLEFLG